MPCIVGALDACAGTQPKNLRTEHNSRAHPEAALGKSQAGMARATLMSHVPLAAGACARPGSIRVKRTTQDLFGFMWTAAVVAIALACMAPVALSNLPSGPCGANNQRACSTFHCVFEPLQFFCDHYRPIHMCGDKFIPCHASTNASNDSAPS